MLLALIARLEALRERESSPREEGEALAYCREALRALRCRPIRRE